MRITEAQTWRKMLSETTYPQLYSKRGFEKSRIRCIIPFDRTEMGYITDRNGVKLIANLL
jgi:hypothetical protein